MGFRKLMPGDFKRKNIVEPKLQTELPEEVKVSARDEAKKKIIKAAEQAPQPEVKEEAPKPKREGGISDTLGTALLTALPTALGGLLQGAEGAASGAKVGTGAAQKFQAQVQANEAAEQRAEQEQTQFDRKLQQQRELAEIEADKQKEITGIKSDADLKKAGFDRETKFGIQERQQKFQKSLAEAANAEKLLKKQELQKKEGFNRAKTLRDQFNKDDITKDTKKLRQAFQKIQISGGSETAAGDLALIFNYMKMLDPGSTVREGEFANAENSAGVPDRIRAQYNKIKTGQRLAPKQRADFLDQAGRLFQGQEELQSGVDEIYRGISERAGVNFEDVNTGVKVRIDSAGSVEGADPNSLESRIGAAKSEEEVAKIMQEAGL